MNPHPGLEPPSSSSNPATHVSGHRGRGSNIDAFGVEAALKAAGVAGQEARRGRLLQGVALGVYMRDQKKSSPGGSSSVPGACSSRL